MPPSGGILGANFFDLKICKTAKLAAVESLLKFMELVFFVISLSDIFKLIIENDKTRGRPLITLELF